MKKIVIWLLICIMISSICHIGIAAEEKDAEELYQKIQINFPYHEVGGGKNLSLIKVTKDGFYMKKGDNYVLVTFDGKVYWDNQYKVYEELYGSMLRPEKQGELYGYVDDGGRWRIPPVFLKGEDFHNGIAIVNYNKEGEEWCAYIDMTGKIQYENKYESGIKMLYPFNNGYGIAMDGNTYTIFNANMEKIVEMKNCLDFSFWNGEDEKEFYYCYITLEEPKKVFIKNFSHQKIAVINLEEIDYKEENNDFSVNVLGPDYIEIYSLNNSMQDDYSLNVQHQTFNLKGERVPGNEQYGYYMQFGKYLQYFTKNGAYDSAVFLDDKGTRIGEYRREQEEYGWLEENNGIIYDCVCDPENLDNVNLVNVLFPLNMKINKNFIPEKRESEKEKKERYKSQISVYVNEKKVVFDVEPVQENDRVLVPMRGVFEALGAKVDWEEGRNTAIAEKDGTVIEVTIGSHQMLKNGEEIELDTAARMEGDRTLVPLRAVSEALGAKVEWEELLQTVYIEQ